MVGDCGFSMPFKVTAMPIELDRAMVPPLLRRAKAILDMEKPPLGREGCKDCRLVGEMARICGKG